MEDMSYTRKRENDFERETFKEKMNLKAARIITIRANDSKAIIEKSQQISRCRVCGYRDERSIIS